MSYVKTGFGPGRPRIGEIRAATPGGLANAKWRAENPDAALSTARTSKWRATHPERAVEQARNSILRRKIRDAAPDFQLVLAVAAATADVLYDIQVGK